MHIEIDSDSCTGHGRCYSLAAEVFDVDDAGYGVVRLPDVPPELEAKARAAVTNCPERAITIS